MNMISLCYRRWMMVLYLMTIVRHWRRSMVCWKVQTVIFVLFSLPVWLSLRKSVCSVIWINWMISVWSRSMPRFVVLRDKNWRILLFLNWIDWQKRMNWLMKKHWTRWRLYMTVIIFVSLRKEYSIHSVCLTFLTGISLVTIGSKPVLLLF